MAMTTTLSDLKSLIIRGTSHLFQDEIMLKQWLNEAFIDVTAGVKIEAIYEVPLVDGVLAYPLPADYKAMQAVMVGAVDSPVSILPMLDIGSQEYGYTIFNNQLILKNVVLGGQPLTLYYTAFVPRLTTDTDMVQMDDRYVHCLSYYGMYRVFMLPEIKEVNISIADRYLKMYEDAKRRYQEDMQMMSRLKTVNRVWIR